MGKKIRVILLLTIQFFYSNLFSLKLALFYPVEKEKEKIVEDFKKEYEKKNNNLKILFFNTNRYSVSDFIEAVEKLKNEKIDLIIGPYTSDETILLLEICKYFKIDPPLFSIFATSNILTSHTNFHSIVFSNSFMAKKITDTIENKKTVFVIYLDKDTYSKDLTALLDKYFFKKSIENIKYLKIKEDLDIYKKIGKIIEKDVIIIPIFTSIKDYDVLDYYVSKLEKKNKCNLYSS